MTSASRSTMPCGVSRASTSLIIARCVGSLPVCIGISARLSSIDCHSMPSTAGHRDERPRPEFVLGDRYGISCVGVVAETVEKTLRTLGYTVSRNKPYAGGFITEHYGNPAVGLHAIQLEIKPRPYTWTSVSTSVPSTFRPPGG